MLSTIPNIDATASAESEIVTAPIVNVAAEPRPNADTSIIAAIMIGLIARAFGRKINFKR